MGVNEVVETIKNLNLTFDGKLNSETVVTVVDKIAPYYSLYLLKQFTLSCIAWVAVCFCVYHIARAVSTYIKKEA